MQILSHDMITDKLYTFLLKTFPIMHHKTVEPDDKLLEKGIVDSLGLLEVVEFIESDFEMIVNDEDIIANNFESISAIASYVEQKQNMSK